MFESFKPLYDRVLVKVDEQQEKTHNGLYLPGDNKRPTTGVVIACGSGRMVVDGTVKPLAVVVGDKVFFNNYNHIEIEPGYVTMREDDILGIIGE